MNDNDCSADIAHGLHQLGVASGDTLMVHSSFKSLGPVPGGIETLIQGLVAAIGPTGTLLMPALSWALRPPTIFDIKTTPTNAGAVPEYFRTRPGTTRSLHPTHSVCAIGPRTRELLDAHRIDSTPCGPHSPFRLLAETHGKIVLLGCGLAPNTTMHAIEECAPPPFLFGQSYTFTLRNEQGHTRRKEYKTHGFVLHGYNRRYDRVIELPHTSFLQNGLVLQAPTVVMDAPGLKAAVLPKLIADPYFFVDNKHE